MFICGEFCNSHYMSHFCVGSMCPSHEVILVTELLFSYLSDELKSVVEQRASKQMHTAEITTSVWTVLKSCLPLSFFQGGRSSSVTLFNC